MEKKTNKKTNYEKKLKDNVSKAKKKLKQKNRKKQNKKELYDLLLNACYDFFETEINNRIAKQKATDEEKIKKINKQAEENKTNFADYISYTMADYYLE